MGNSEIPAEESKGSEPIAKAVEPIIENVTRSPGWAYLLMLVSLVTLGFKLQLPLVGQINFHNASLVLTTTYVFYLVGDWIDKRTYKTKDGKERYQPYRLKKARADARKSLGVYEGSYKVAMAILKTSEQGYLSVYALNELAKTFRGLILPVFAIFSCYAYKDFTPIAAIELILIYASIAWLASFWIYPHLKQRHIILLYEKVEKLCADKPETHVEIVEINNGLIGIATFFWEGIAVVTAKQMSAKEKDKLDEDFTELQRERS